MLMTLSKYRMMGLCCLILGLCQCARAPESQLQANNGLASPYTLPAETYLAMAKQEDGPEKQDHILSAGARMIYDGQWRQGLAILSQTSRLTPEQRNEKRLLQAKTDLMRERPQSAIEKLSSIHGISQSPLYHQIQYHEMLAQAYQYSNKTIESVNERMKLEPLLPDETSRTTNRRGLWLSLTKLPAAELSTMVIEAPEDSELQGWLQLANISRQQPGHSLAMVAQVQQWLEKFTSHPANRILPGSLVSVAEKMIEKPKKMALLLPLSGPLSGPAHAVRDGFMSARQDSHFSANLAVYDTSKGSVARVYSQAIAEGANYIVGPLSKPNVAVVAAMSHPVPTLLLNESEVAIKENAYQFGLSPISEAKQVAAKARHNGYTRALVICPADPWGAEVTQAFTQQWNTQGGQVVDTLIYTNNDDLNQKIPDVLHITESQEREKQLKKILGRKLQATPRRRQDFDMVFLLAYPSKARQIMPLLRYYYAGDVPVYATSSVFGGQANTMKDRDLDGIVFCDMPWVFTHQTSHGHWPEQFNSYNRLYALGMDSYALATQLNQLMLFPAMGASDKSGVLYLSSAQQVSRILEWGQFKQGLAKPLIESG